MATTESLPMVWIVDDGEKHWVIASSRADAIKIVSQSHGWESVQAYLDDVGEPKAAWAPFDEPIKINVTDAVKFIGKNDYPPHTQVYVTVMPHDARQHMAGVICSSVW